MEKLTESTFGKFEGSQLSNLKAIGGGEGATAAGSRCMKDGSCMYYESDYDNGPGSISYMGVTYKKNEC